MGISMNEFSLHQLLIQHNKRVLCIKKIQTLILRNNIKILNTKQGGKSRFFFFFLLLGSWVQERCIWYSWSRVSRSDPVACSREGSCIHSWYLGTCSLMYGTRITFSPIKLISSSSLPLTSGSSAHHRWLDSGCQME